MRTCRLIYRSVAQPGVLNREALSKLLEQCVTNNKRLGIKGLLVVSGQRFLQVLEGPPRFVNETFNAIVKDERHHEIDLISYEGTAKPYFYDWNMQIVSLDDLDERWREMFQKKYPGRSGLVEFPDDPILVHSLLLDAKYVTS